MSVVYTSKQLAMSQFIYQSIYSQLTPLSAYFRENKGGGSVTPPSNFPLEKKSIWKRSIIFCAFGEIRGSVDCIWTDRENGKTSHFTNKNFLFYEDFKTVRAGI